MNKDYIHSTKYTSEELHRLDVPYVLYDACVDELADYINCRRYQGGYLDNTLMYSIPGLMGFSNCGLLNTVYKRCQDKRERDIFEQLTRIYKETYKQTEEASMNRLKAQRREVHTEEQSKK